MLKRRGLGSAAGSQQTVTTLRDIVACDTAFFHVVPNLPIDLRDVEEEHANMAVRYALGWWLPEDGEFGRGRQAKGKQATDYWMKKVDVLEDTLQRWCRRKDSAEQRGLKPWISEGSCNFYRNMMLESASMAICNARIDGVSRANSSSRQLYRTWSIHSHSGLGPFGMREKLKRTNAFRTQSLDETVPVILEELKLDDEDSTKSLSLDSLVTPMKKYAVGFKRWLPTSMDFSKLHPAEKHPVDFYLGLMRMKEDMRQKKEKSFMKRSGS